MEYESAGCLFHDKSSFLAGFQRKQQRWTSFGGKKYHGETAFQTAMREVVEELFENQITQQTLARLICIIPLSLPNQDGTYIYYKYDYNVIFQIIQILKEDGYISPLYDEWPSTMKDLVTKRKKCMTCEIQYIQIFQSKDILQNEHYFDKFFFMDLTKLFQNLV
jgi:hypothetical protein